MDKVNNKKRKATKDVAPRSRHRRLKTRHESAPPYIDTESLLDSLFNMNDDSDLSDYCEMEFDEEFAQPSSSVIAGQQSPNTAGVDAMPASSDTSTIATAQITSCPELSLSTTDSQRSTAVDSETSGALSQCEALKSHFADIFDESDDDDDSYSSFMEAATVPRAGVTADVIVNEEDTTSQELKDLLTSKKSYLAKADKANIEDIISAIVASISEESKAALNKFCPSGDTVEETIDSIHFKEALEVFQDVLSVGGFARKAKGKTDEERSFKDDNFEEYWGERLERDLKKKFIEAERMNGALSRTKNE